MNHSLFKALGLSLSLMFVAQSGHSALIKDTNKTVNSTVVTKQSPIEKALSQQKRGDNNSINDELKVLTAIKSAPTQNFLAEQNQKFSRFIQALFQPHSSS
ncbi:hypothetical protein [Acinetobacter gerneri]|jgi:hypothetical protein|uniref:DUF4179 domain-containing protein n=2 Tax=Acinetobacter gerneri TaxID=202952 RepID=N8ZDF0_9GAMM|nr:hypothetical protein [Acinetobacter gerneri]ENV31724.1 hypothetical protein F960_04089 [Acinetobacter gerneri DSM 14967 = CIP 107464 = MTCC 9824]EPR83757.1 putative exported protein [Acinetobacter gerneri DSM 14967 = CIP 107464 = MTCC 9824]MCH4245904.1 DUF4179 domain-containing protein [Acinetobacter gerneri]MDQ9008552.1 DUF4179 domain-containing protein [Acinetobacter gerneri]MDQ9012483.1 DUF4179 domain-containing protein [Acinetobacter gerneri]